MIARIGTIAAIHAGLLLVGCSGLWGDDEFERYSQRTDVITMSAGDAKQVNAIAQMHDPWPPGVGDRQILADGVRMQRALRSYRRGTSPPDPLPAIDLEGRPLGTVLRPSSDTGGLSSLPSGSSVNVPVGGQ